MLGKKRQTINVLNMIHTTTVVEGKIQTTSSIRIDGQLQGTLESTKNIIIGKEAKVIGDIKGKNITLEGYVQGNIQTEELLQITSTARIYGDLIYKTIEIEPGAIFVGKSHHLANEGNAVEETENNTEEVMHVDKEKIEKVQSA